MVEHREKPDGFVEPTKDELKARTRRNVAIAIALVVWVVFVFVTMISRGGGS